jgi:uncharacterized protein
MVSDVKLLITITLAWSPSERSIYARKLSVTNGSTIEEALEQAFTEKLPLPEDWRSAKLGIYGKLKPRDTVLRDQDRIEIHRALKADPKQARRLRAKKNPLKKPVPR